MYLFIVALHIACSLILVAVILLQPGKGGDPGSAFGGGMSSGVFGPRGPTNVLQQATTIAAMLFMVTSISLALYSNKKVMSGSDVGNELQQLQQQQSGGTSTTPPPTPAPAPAPAPAPSEGTPAPSDGTSAPSDGSTPAPAGGGQ